MKVVIKSTGEEFNLPEHSVEWVISTLADDVPGIEDMEVEEHDNGDLTFSRKSGTKG